MAEDVVNLIDRKDVTAALIADPLAWRVRVVEEVTVDSATSCIRRRSLQVAPLRDVLGRRVPRRATRALLALNVAPMPRGPLLDFDVEGPSGPAWLLPRTEIAARQCEYLLSLAEVCGVTPTSQTKRLLTAILGFTGELLRPDGFSLHGYLRDGVGRAFDPHLVNEWERVANRCSEILRPRLDEYRGYSAPENPALVLPELFVAAAIESDQDATQVLEDYVALLERLSFMADGADAPTVADEFLDSLADYANYYDMIVALEVPIDEPFLVKFSERRDLRLGAGNQGEQDLVIADALSNHVSFKVLDPNVRIVKFEAEHPASESSAYGAFKTRMDAQSTAFYAHDPERDYRIRLKFQLRLLKRLQVVPYLIAVLLLALTVSLWISKPTDLPTLALVVGPSALAASVVLYREPTTLGTRLRLITSMILVSLLIGLILSAIALYVLGPNVLGCL